jgi:hypothetical protein
MAGKSAEHLALLSGVKPIEFGEARVIPWHDEDAVRVKFRGRQDRSRWEGCRDPETQHWQGHGQYGRLLHTAAPSSGLGYAMRCEFHGESGATITQFRREGKT